MDDESSNSNDVIEISDDSCEAIYDSAAGTSGSALKRPSVDSDEYNDSDESDDVQFIEEESESEPEYECDSWDDDCKVVNISVTTKLIQGIHHTKYISIPEQNNIKRLKLSVQLNEQLNDETTFKSFKENFLNDNAFEEKSCELITDPWKVLVINNLLDDASILDEIRQEFYEINWNIRTMDLYEFIQSEDLKNIQAESIGLVHDFLKGELMDWVSKLTGVELVQVSATCSFYSDTDFLLVHDDQRDTRAVAFVLYLTGKEGWSVDWGGCLQLLNADEDKQPLKVTRNIMPRNNQLVLFPVSDKSYHQVEEVQCKNFCRMSINGWFHTKEPLAFDTPLYKPPADGLYASGYLRPEDVDIDLSQYIDDGYLVKDTVASIQAYIEEHSEMSLEFYFNEGKIAEICDLLNSSDIKWKSMGPPNRRNYEYISNDTDADAPPALSTFLALLKSKQFFSRLDQYTGLELRKMRWELQRWTPGSYSLITQDNPDRLDVMFCLGDTAVVGGKTHYVTLDQEVQMALITMGCEANYLNLVYGDTARYTSLISKYSRSSCFYMFVASYFEEPQEAGVDRKEGGAGGSGDAPYSINSSGDVEVISDSANTSSELEMTNVEAGSSRENVRIDSPTTDIKE